MYTGTKIATIQSSSSSSTGNNYNLGTKNINHPNSNVGMTGASSSGYRKFLHRRVNTQIDQPSHSYNYGQSHQQTNSNIGTNSKYYPYQYQNQYNLSNNIGQQNYKKDSSKNRLQSYIHNNAGSIQSNLLSSNIPNNIISNPINTNSALINNNLPTNSIVNNIPASSNNKQVSSALNKNYKFSSKTNGIMSKYVKTQPDLDDQLLQSNRNRPNPTNRNIIHNSHKNTQISNSKYQIEGVAGKGTFGVVYFGKVISTGQKIAVKKVLQDKKYKNRELEILKQVKHSNILVMKDFFISNQGSEEYLNVIMDYYSDNLYQVIKRKQMTPLMIKLYIYQILRGLNYLSSLSIAHRDIKPQNILVDRNTNKVVICDFGSAKKLVKGQPNIAYICSRCYRAPELIFGATQYTSQIDMWSLGCVIVQMINGQAPFLGDSQIDQLLQIIKILGTPQKADIQEMNPKYDLKQHKKFPNIKPVPWRKILKTQDALLVDLVTKILQYSPKKRFSAAEALKHPYFQQLKQFSDMIDHKDMQYLKKMKIKQIPQLFDYTPNEIISLGIDDQRTTKTYRKEFMKEGQKNQQKQRQKLQINIPLSSHQIQLSGKSQREKQKVKTHSRMESGNIIQGGVKLSKQFRASTGQKEQKVEELNGNLNIEEDSIKLQKSTFSNLNNNQTNGTVTTLGTGSNTQSGSKLHKRIPASSNYGFSTGIVHLSNTGPSLGTNAGQNFGKITSNRFQYR